MRDGGADRPAFQSIKQMHLWRPILSGDRFYLTRLNACGLAVECFYHGFFDAEPARIIGEGVAGLGSLFALSSAFVPSSRGD